MLVAIETRAAENSSIIAFLVFVSFTHEIVAPSFVSRRNMFGRCSPHYFESQEDGDADRIRAYFFHRPNGGSIFRNRAANATGRMNAGTEPDYRLSPNLTHSFFMDQGEYNHELCPHGRTWIVAKKSHRSISHEKKDYQRRFDTNRLS
ncbi:hypothetical protein M426DRAFT_20922 [Hypoxylon sp. CI-4A]|nr:hypothetical protein M426DRAFT_20922 [Hypoxylon sp. CI-4A]